MYRKESINIREWINNSNKALLVTGARQTGKTWLIRDEIEKSEYSIFEINFINQPEMIDFLNIFNQVKGDFGNNLDLFLDLSMVLYNIGISKGYKLKTNEMKRNLKGIQ